LTRERLSICYAVPGHNLLHSAGPTRNVLSLAEALSPWADVTVAFRKVLEPVSPERYEIVEIHPGQARSRHSVDDGALRDMTVWEFISYLRSVRRFVRERAHTYDILLEKSWLLTGYMSSICQSRGLPAVVVSNIVRVWNEPLQKPQDFLKYLRHLIAAKMTGRYLRRSSLIIAETEELKVALVERARISGDRIEVVGLGVNRTLFRPLQQMPARMELGISRNATVLLYVGVLDRTHDLMPVLEALSKRCDSELELHIVGDGELRPLYEEKAQSCRQNVFFHGRVPHKTVPKYIAAADLCLAPYNPSSFHHGEVAYSSLKIPEYKACGRPVVSVPSGHILKLIEDGVSGYLFNNEVKNWLNFCQHFPSRERLKSMGEAALGTAGSHGWEKTARAYLSLCEGTVRKQNLNKIRIALGHTN
jgi:glycosyltransferase involved in cell wall biosynthesis